MKSFVFTLAIIMLSASALHAEVSDLQKFGLEEELIENKVTAENIEKNNDVSAETIAKETDEVKAEEEHTSKIIEKLNLTPEQLLAAKKIQAKGEAEMTNILIQIEALRKEVREIEERNLDEFMSLLNEEQKQLFLQFMATNE